MDCPVPDRSFERSPYPFLLEAPDGDVLAARAAARKILCGVELKDGEIACATLFLTATLLECAIRDGQGVTRAALVGHLNDIARSGLSGAGMRTSRLQFSRYAAAEIDALTPMQRCQVITTLLAATAEPSADKLARENVGDNGNGVRI